MTTKLKMAIIAGADAALKYRQKNTHASDSEVMQNITKSIQDIMDKIDLED